MPALDEYWGWGNQLESLGFMVQRRVHGMMGSGATDLAVPVAEEGGDTIFKIDRNVEAIVLAAIESWPATYKSVELIIEGLGTNGRLTIGGSSPRFRLIVDPIDGTRGIMYDKRSAWFIAAVAPNCGSQTALSHVVAAVLVELPTSKQTWCDSFVAVRGAPVRGQRTVVGGGVAQDLSISPSQADTLDQGFAQVSNFFPGTKVLASELMERIVAETVGDIRPGHGSVFDDQYISSGGQMVELILGHDRFCCDLRPLFYQILRNRGEQSVLGLECHPYDVAGALVASEAGVILTDGFGCPLDAPLNVFEGVHWCGYANETLRQQIEPVIVNWLGEHGLIQPS